MSILTSKSILITPGSFSSSNNAISQIDLKWVESGVGTFVFRPNVNDLRSTIYNWQQNSEPVILFGGIGTVNGVRKFAGPYQDYTGTFSGITSFPQIQFFPLSGTIYANTLALSGIASFNQIYSAGLSTFGSINLLGPLYDQTFNSGSVNQVLTSTVNGVAWSTPSTYGNISGLGITNYVSKFSNSTSLTTSNIIDNGSLVTVGIGMSVNGFTTVAGSFVSTGNAGIGTNIYSNVRLVTRSADSTSATESFRAIDSTGTATFQVTGAGSVGIGSLSAIYRLNVFHNTTNASVGAYQANLEVTQTLATARSILGGRFSVTGRINATSTNNIYGIYGLIGFSYASAGVTNSGEIAAGAFDARTSNANHSGTNAMQMAVFAMYNASASATGLGTIQNAYGGRFIADYGYPTNFTIQNSFGVRVQSTNSTSYPQNSFGFYEDLASAANAKNFFLNPVGIGTSSPTQNLHVQGNARLTGGLYDSTNSPGSTNQILSSTGSGIAWTSFNSSGIFTGTVAPNQVAIGSTGNRLQGFSTFIFDSTGLSIGTSIPEQRLTVSGSVKATGTVTANQFISTTFTDPPLVVNSQSLVTNLNSEYWKDQAYPLSTTGDLLYSSDNSGTAARLAPNTTTVIKVLTQVGDGVEASAPSWQPLPSSGFLQYFFTGLAATNAPQNYQLANDLPVGLGTTSINFTSGEALVAQFITDPGVPNLEYLPAGNLAAYVWGLQTISTTIAAVPTVQLRVDFYETTSLGTSIAKIVSSNDSTELVPTAERYTLIGITTGTYNLASRSSRIQARVYAVHGLTGIATVNVFYGNGYDSLVQIVAPGADVTNFVPYQGAVNNVDLGIKNLRAGAVGLYTGFSTVAPEQGQFIWNSTTQEVDLGLSDGYSVSVGFENALRVYNNTLNTIGVGSVVYVTGSAGNIPTVDLASAALFDSSTVVGVTNRLIAPASYGYIYTYGTIDYNTSSFVSGDNLFLSDTQAGILTSISPLAPSFSVLVGTVLNSGTSGSIVVLQNSINSLNESSRILFANSNKFPQGISTFVYSRGNVGIGTTAPTQNLHVQGNARLTGGLYDSTNSPGSLGQILSSTGSGIAWTSVNTTGILTANGGISNRVTKFLDEDTLGNSNITDTGTLITLGSGVTVSGILTSFGYYGPGTFITNLNASNLASGTVPSSVVSGSYSGITSVGNLTQLNVTGITTSNIFVGNGSNITNLNASNLTSGIVNTNRISGSYSGITSVGTLTQLNVAGITTSTSVRISNQLYDSNFSSGSANQILISTGNAIVWTSVNVTGILTANGGISNRVTKFLDEDTLGNSNITDTGTLITLGSGVTVSGILTSFGFFGPGTFITNLNASNLVSGTVPSTVISGAYSGITSVGSLTQLNVTGITTSNIFVGNGSNITNLNAVNLASGIVPSAVISGSYSGITSVGTLTQLNVAGITTSTRIRISNQLYDSNFSSGTQNQLLISTGVGISWTSTTATGIVTGTGAATRVAYFADANTLTSNSDFIVNSFGFIGISTNIPRQRLDVFATARFSGNVLFYGSTSNDAIGLTQTFDTIYQGTNNVLRFRQGGSTAGAVAFSFYDNLPALFMIFNATDSPRVGIGTTGPLQTLHVGGNALISGITTALGFSGFGTGLTNLNASNLAFGTVPSAVVSGSYSGITSVGNLTQLNVTGITSTVNLRLSGILFDNNFSSGTQNQVLISTGTGVAWTNSNSTGILTGSGTINVVPKFSGPNSLTTSNITDNGLAVTVASRLNVVGVGSFTNDLIVNQMTVGLGSQQSTGNVAIGFQAFQTATSVSASGNVAIGDRALQTTSGAIFGNVAVGQLALAVNQGLRNIAVGGQALGSNTSGSSNIAIGYQALLSATTDLGNIAIGNRAMWLLTGGSGGANIAIGGAGNLTTAAEITVVGSAAANNYTSQGQHVAIGAYALSGVSTSTATGTQNTAIGYAVMTGITGGSSNVGLGHYALNALTSGNSNTGIGYLALRYYSTVSNQVAVGYQALQGSATTTFNTGTQNTAVGYQAGFANTSGSNNVFVGYQAGTANTSGSNNNFIGNIAGFSNLTGVNNQALGSGALYSARSGNNHVAIGNAALFSLTGSIDNIGIGFQAAYYVVSGDANIVIGRNALFWSTSASNNVAIGYQAMLNLNNPSNQTAIGYNALQGSATTTLNTGTQNTVVGYLAGTANTAGSNNTFVGQQAGDGNTSGSFNSYFGALTDGAPAGSYQIALGNSVVTTASNLGAWGGNTNSTRTDLGIGTFTSLARLHVETLAAGNMGLYIAGSVSQTGDLVEVNATTVGRNYFTITGIGSVGIYTNTPSQAFDVNGGTRLRGRLFDSNNNSGTQNQLLISTGVGISWTSATATGIVTGTGTATQVAYWNSANQIAGNNNFVFNGVGSVGINTTSPEYALHVVGTLAATIKSFIIAHPTKPGRKLRYASLEGPENGVYLRGRTDETKIILPEYWRGLVDHDSITVNITPIGTFSKFCVEKIENYVIHVKNKNMFNKKQEYFYVVFGERKDVDKLEVEI